MAAATATSSPPAGQTAAEAAAAVAASQTDPYAAEGAGTVAGAAAFAAASAPEGGEDQAAATAAEAVLVTATTEAEEASQRVDVVSSPYVKDVIGGRLMFFFPIDGLSVGISGYTGNTHFRDPFNSRFHVYGAQLEYLSEAFLLRSEYTNSIAVNEDEEKSEKVLEFESFYVEAAVKPTFVELIKNFQLALRYELKDISAPAGDPYEYYMSRIFEHQAISIGLNYWFNPNFVLKLSYSKITGNFYAYPENVYEDLVAGKKLEDETDQFLAGAQFSF